MSLAETREELIESVQDGLSVLMNPVRIERVALDLEEAAAWFEAIGICNLLLYADADGFYENLIRSGHTRRYYLRKSREQGNTNDYQLAISRWDSFLDVAAAGDFRLARDVVALSVDTWTPTGEYEDDFLYRHFLHQFVAPRDAHQGARLTSILASWHSWLSGQASPRLDCCSALLARDSVAFDAAFVDLIAFRHAEIKKQSKMSLAADPCFEPRSRIFVEGLALLRLAHTIGLGVRSDFPLCPAIARAPPVKPFPEDIFPEIERERDQGGS